MKWFDYYYSHERNARLTCRCLGISPQTFYRWKRRYDPKRPDSLEDRSHRPEHPRQPTAPKELVEAVLKLREEHPGWGKEKLPVLSIVHDGGPFGTVPELLFEKKGLIPAIRQLLYSYA